MSKQAQKPEPVDVTGVMPNLVTHVATRSQASEDRDEVLVAIAGAMERELLNGRQFYTLPVGQTWCVFYNGQARVH
mgnify:FL=1